MDKQTKLTLDELIRRKEQMLSAKKKPATRELYIESLERTIVIAEQKRSTFVDAQEMGSTDADSYIVLQSVIEPDLKRAAQEYGCAEPTEIVDIIFKPGEVGGIAQNVLDLSGVNDHSVSIAKDIKN